eukprot:TRINITY_DN2969_c0_g1_i1.p1 TRINITY_DN2969_c0_g1~~TRINITY_DN2969_c0_g1_i1.p1  ORF type:complete len:1602 (+),score=346.41 TRINITY_DN2969_c0_g1_i1:715-4806(+)
MLHVDNVAALPDSPQPGVKRPVQAWAAQIYGNDISAHGDPDAGDPDPPVDARKDGLLPPPEEASPAPPPPLPPPPPRLGQLGPSTVDVQAAIADAVCPLVLGRNSLQDAASGLGEAGGDPVSGAARMLEHEARQLQGVAECITWIADLSAMTMFSPTGAAAAAARDVRGSIASGASGHRRGRRRRGGSVTGGPQGPTEMPLDGPGCVAACCRGDTDVIGDLRTHPLYDMTADGAWAPGLATAIPIPHPSRVGSPVGCIVAIATVTTDSLPTETVAALGALCRSAAGSVAAAAALSAARSGSAAWRLQAESAIEVALSAAGGGLSAMLSRVSELGCAALGASRCTVWVVSSDASQVWALSDPSDASSRREYKPLGGRSGRAGLHPVVRAALSGDIMCDGSIHAVPLPSAVPGVQLPVGVLEVAKVGHIPPSWSELLETFATAGAAALGAALRMKHTEDEAAQLARLVHIVNVLGRPRDIPSFVVALQRQLRQMVDCDAARFFLFDADRERAEYFSKAEKPQGRLYNTFHGPLKECAEQRNSRELRVFSRVEDAQAVMGHEGCFGVKSLHNLLLVPLLDDMHENVLGVVALANRRGGDYGSGDSRRFTACSVMDNDSDDEETAALPAVSPMLSSPTLAATGPRLSRSSLQALERRLPDGYAEFSAADKKRVEIVVLNLAGRLQQLQGEEPERSRAALREYLQTLRKQMRVVDCVPHVTVPNPIQAAPRVPSVVPGPPVAVPPRLFLPLTVPAKDPPEVWGVLEFVGDDIYTDGRRMQIAQIGSRLSAKLYGLIGPCGRRGELGSVSYRGFVEAVAPWEMALQQQKRGGRGRGDEPSSPRHGGLALASPVSAPLSSPRAAQSPRAVNKVSWRRGRVIGRGGFGTVHVAQNTATGELLAVKTMVFNPADPQIWKKVQQLQAEIQLMRRLEHTSIVAYIGSEREGNQMHILMEYVSGGSVADNLKQFGAFSDDVAATYTYSVLSGLCYLHSQEPPVMHRDIKGANVLISRGGSAKLADFGSAAMLDVSAPLGGGSGLPLQGTAQWMAPEVITSQTVATPSDIWSLGCTVMEMLTGKAPWAHVHATPLQVLNFVGDEEEDIESVLLPKDCKAQDAVRDFIAACLKRAPDERPSAFECAEHHWVQDAAAAQGPNITPPASPRSACLASPRAPAFSDCASSCGRSSFAASSVGSFFQNAFIRSDSMVSEVGGGQPTPVHEREDFLAKLRALADDAGASQTPAVRAWAQSLGALLAQWPQGLLALPTSSGSLRRSSSLVHPGKSPVPPGLSPESPSRRRSGRSPADPGMDGDDFCGSPVGSPVARKLETRLVRRKSSARKSLRLSTAEEEDPLVEDFGEPTGLSIQRLKSDP